MRILITGGAGFIGTRLSARLVGEGHDVTIFDVLHPQVHTSGDYQPPSGVTLVRGDVAVAGDWDRLLEETAAPEAIVHLAAETGTGQSLREASRHAGVNVLGTAAMTDALVRFDITPERIVLTSSRAVYGEGAWTNDVDGVFYPSGRVTDDLEAARWDPQSPSGSGSAPIPHRAADVWARPVNVYAATKLAQEHLLESWCTSFGVDLGVLRLQNVYGPGQAVGNAYTGVLTFFAVRAAQGLALDVYEDGAIVRDFVFVDDVVDALTRSLALAGPRPTVDIGCGTPTTLLDVAETMSSIADIAPPRVTGQYRHGDVRAASADVTAARDVLGWEPTTSLTDGLTALIERVRTEVN